MALIHVSISLGGGGGGGGGGPHASGSGRARELGERKEVGDIPTWSHNDNG